MLNAAGNKLLGLAGNFLGAGALYIVKLASYTLIFLVGDTIYVLIRKLLEFSVDFLGICPTAYAVMLGSHISAGYFLKGVVFDVAHIILLR